MFLKIGDSNKKIWRCAILVGIAAAVVFAVLFTVMARPSYGGSGISQEDVLDVSRKIKYPPDNVIDAVVSRKTGDGMVDFSKDPLFNGMNNSFYQHTLDMPLTRFVLGNVELNSAGIDAVFKAENALRSKGSSWHANYESSSGSSPLISYDLSGIDAVGANAGKVFKFLMGPLGIILLVVSFMCQVAMIGYNGLMHDRGFSAVPLQAVVFRLIIFMLAIGFFSSYVSGLISFSNYISNMILPMGTQPHLIASIATASVNISDGASSIGSIIGNFFRVLAYVCVKILIIMRDVLMALTLVTGTTCIAFGYFSTYGRQEPMREYLSGWIRNFATLLLWGPFAALVLNAMGIVSILSATGEVSSVASGIFGLAALFAAKDIPNMSREFGHVALASLIGMIAPAVSHLTVGGAGAAVVVGGSLAGRGAAGTVRGLRNIGDRHLERQPGVPIAGAMAGSGSSMSGGTATPVAAGQNTAPSPGGGGQVSPRGNGRGADSSAGMENNTAPYVPIAGIFGQKNKPADEKKKKTLRQRLGTAGSTAFREGIKKADQGLAEEEGQNNK